MIYLQFLIVTFHDFLWSTIKFHDFQGLENEIFKFQYFPGFPSLTKNYHIYLFDDNFSIQL